MASNINQVIQNKISDFRNMARSVHQAINPSVTTYNYATNPVGSMAVDAMKEIPNVIQMGYNRALFDKMKAPYEKMYDRINEKIPFNEKWRSLANEALGNTSPFHEYNNRYVPMRNWTQRPDRLPDISGDFNKMFKEVLDARDYNNPEFVVPEHVSFGDYLKGIGQVTPQYVADKLNPLSPQKLHTGLETVTDKYPVLEPVHNALHDVVDLTSKGHDHKEPTIDDFKNVLPEGVNPSLASFLHSLYKDKRNARESHGHPGASSFKDPYNEALHFQAHITNHMITLTGIDKDIFVNHMPMDDLIRKYSYFLNPSDVYTIVQRQTRPIPPLSKAYELTPEEQKKRGIQLEMTPEKKKKMDQEIDTIPLAEFGPQLMGLASKYGFQYFFDRVKYPYIYDRLLNRYRTERKKK